RGAGRTRVRPRQMIALTAAAVVEDGLAAPGVADAREARGHLTDRGVPIDRLEGTVVAPAEGGGQAMPAVLVGGRAPRVSRGVAPRRLLAGVALRGGVRLVAADARQPAPVELHLDAAVDAAQDAGGLVPVGHGTPGARSGFNE